MSKPDYSAPLLDPLLALLGIDIARRAQPALVPRHQRAQQPVLAHPADGVVVALGRPGPGVELRPVDLREGDDRLSMVVPRWRLMGGGGEGGARFHSHRASRASAQTAGSMPPPGSRTAGRAA